MNPPPTFGGAKAPPEGEKFASCLGKFILNCGVLEFHTYCWMIGLSPNSEIPPGASELSWADRVCWIRRNIKSRKITPSIRSEVIKELNTVQKMYELRNIVAHGPMIWGNQADGTLFAVVPNVKKSLAGKPSKIVGFSDIEAAISESEDIYRRMEDLLGRVVADIAPPVSPYLDTPAAPKPPKC